MRWILKDGQGFNRQRWQNEVFWEVDMGGFYFLRGNKKEVCVSVWVWVIKVGRGGGIKNKIEKFKKMKKWREGNVF